MKEGVSCAVLPAACSQCIDAAGRMQQLNVECPDRTLKSCGNANCKSALQKFIDDADAIANGLASCGNNTQLSTYASVLGTKSRLLGMFAAAINRQCGTNIDIQTGDPVR